MHYSVHERAQDVAPGEAWSYVLCLHFKRNIFLISCRSDDLPEPAQPLPCQVQNITADDDEAQAPLRGLTCLETT
jgi:hypothetical protein